MTVSLAQRCSVHLASLEFTFCACERVCVCVCVCRDLQTTRQVKCPHEKQFYRLKLVVVSFGVKSLGCDYNIAV